MNGAVLADAGPLVALLHRRDRHHEACVRTFRQLTEPMLTTWMHVFEAMRLLEFSLDARCALLQMIERRAVRVLAAGTADLAGIRELLVQYSDPPIDFADATLVHLAMRDRLDTIFTLDRGAFSRYRLDGNRRFKIVPER